MAHWGATAYAKRDGAHLAYRVSDGEGEAVIALMPGFEPLSSITEHYARSAFDRLAGFGRSILTERRGVGESDPIDLARPPSLDDVADDLVAVLDHVGSEEASIWAFATPPASPS
jgi:pimeloyl-ACP methyl ester carboxylesterase